MKRIHVAVTNDLTYDQRMQRTCNTLSEEGYEVTLIGRRRSGSLALRDLPYRCVRLRCVFRRGFAFYAEFNLRLFFYLLFASTDVIVACDLDTALAVVLSGKLRGKVMIYDAHELFSEVPELSGRNSVQSIWNKIGRFAVPKVAARYTVGPALARVLEERYRVPFGVVRNVPEMTSLQVPSLEQRSPVILYQGALNAGRGLECAIDAMAYIEGFTLRLVGEGDFSATLRQRVIDAGLQDKVEFMGRVAPSDLPLLTQQAVLGLNLLERTSLSYYYSLANKLFDYMHAGVPSVNMAFPEYTAILNLFEIGVTLTDLDTGRYVQAITALLSDEARLRRMHENCLRARAEFCWEREREVLLDIYRGALRTKP